MNRLRELAAFGGLLFGVVALATLGLKAQDWVEEAAEKKLGVQVRQNTQVLTGIEQDVLRIKYALQADSVVTQAKLDAILNAITDGRELE